MASSAKSIAVISAVKMDALLDNLWFIDMLFMITAHPTCHYLLTISLEINFVRSDLSMRKKVMYAL